MSLNPFFFRSESHSPPTRMVKELEHFGDRMRSVCHSRRGTFFAHLPSSHGPALFPHVEPAPQPSQMLGPDELKLSLPGSIAQHRRGLLRRQHPGVPEQPSHLLKTLHLVRKLVIVLLVLKPQGLALDEEQAVAVARQDVELVASRFGASHTPLTPIRTSKSPASRATTKAYSS